jgi:hypothetical protein
LRWTKAEGKKQNSNPKVAVFVSGIDRDQMLKEEPHPQVLLAFGLVTTKREPSRPSV